MVKLPGRFQTGLAILSAWRIEIVLAARRFVFFNFNPKAEVSVGARHPTKFLCHPNR